MARSKRNYPPHIEESIAKTCEAGACSASGLYKAPKAPHAEGEYHWFCLEHAEEYNRKWDYFSNMDQAEIEAFIHDAVTGHRPTWQRDGSRDARYAMYGQQLEEELEKFLRGSYINNRNRAANRLGGREREALALLALDTPCDAAALKQAFRNMAKQYHPDLHKGDKQYEEKFKRITAAYLYLRELYAAEPISPTA